MKSTSTRRKFAIGSAATFASIGIIPGKARAADYVLKFSTTEPVEAPVNVRGKQAFDRIRKETNGRVDVQLFPNNILGGLTAVLTQVRTGAVAFTTVDGISISGLVDVAAITGVGFTFKTIAGGLRAFDGELGEYVRKDIRAKGLWVHDKMMLIGMRNVTSYPHPIHTPDDFKGFKIRTPPGRLSVDLFKSFGASVAPLNISEVYTALQTHVIDGQENPFLNIAYSRFYEVQKYLSLTSHQWSGYNVIGNQDVWNTLPRDLQDVVYKNFTQYINEQRRDNEIFNVAMLDKLQRQGMKVNPVDQAPFKAELVSSGFYERWKKEFGPTAWALLEKYVGKVG